jgi:hypothetical protein
VPVYATTSPWSCLSRTADQGQQPSLRRGPRSGALGLVGAPGQPGADRGAVAVPGRRFRVAPQFRERVADLGIGDVGQGAVRVELIGDPVEHACVGAQRVRVALDLRGVEEGVDGGADGRPAAFLVAVPEPRRRLARFVTVTAITTSVPIDLPDNEHESRCQRRGVRAGHRSSLWISLPDNGPLSGRAPRSSPEGHTHCHADERTSLRGQVRGAIWEQDPAMNGPEQTSTERSDPR